MLHSIFRFRTLKLLVSEKILRFCKIDAVLKVWMVYNCKLFNVPLDTVKSVHTPKSVFESTRISNVSVQMSAITIEQPV